MTKKEEWSFEDTIKFAAELQEELNELRYQPHKLSDFISKLRERRVWFGKTEQDVRNDNTEKYTRTQKLILSIMDDLVDSDLQGTERILELEDEIKSLKDQYEPVS